MSLFVHVLAPKVRRIYNQNHCQPDFIAQTLGLTYFHCTVKDQTLGDPHLLKRTFIQQFQFVLWLGYNSPLIIVKYILVQLLIVDPSHLCHGKCEPNCRPNLIPNASGSSCCLLYLIINCSLNRFRLSLIQPTLYSSQASVRLARP